MKKVLLLILSLALAIGVAIPMAAPVMANTSVMPYLGINSNADPYFPDGPFNHAGVREAIYLALDRDEIAASQGGVKVISIVNPSVSNPLVNRPFDPALAKQKLADAGYPNGFATTLTIPDTPNMNNLANVIREYLAKVGIKADIEALDQATFTAKLTARQLPFFLVSTPVDNTFMPAEALGRLLLWSSPQNFTGYNRAQFDYLFNLGQYGNAENYAFNLYVEPPVMSLPIIPLFYWGTPYFTIRVHAATNPGQPDNIMINGAPVTWSKTGGGPNSASSGTGNTSFDIFLAGGEVTLTASTNYQNELNYFKFKEWWVGTPPAETEIKTTNNPVTFTPTSDKLATAIYKPQIGSLGYIYPQTSDINPIGISHTVWVNVFRPVDGGKVAVSGIKVKFNITGANPAGSGFAYTDGTGKATFTYTGGSEGRDDILAYVDSNNNSQFDSSEPRSINTSVKTWVKNYVTSSGSIKEGKKVIGTFSGTVGVLPEGGAVGQFEIVDKANGVTYTLDQFIVLMFSGPVGGSPEASHNTVRFRGIGTRSTDGARVEVVVVLQDNGEPGAGVDTIAAEVARVGTASSSDPNSNILVIPLLGSHVYTPESYYPSLPPLPPSPLPPIAFVTIDGGNVQMHNLPTKIDQQNIYTEGTSIGCGTPATGSIYQSFTPSDSDLKGVDLLFRAGGSFPIEGTNITIKVRSGTFNGEILGTATTFVTGPKAVGTQFMVSFKFAPGLNLIPGQIYVIEWDEDIAGDVVVSWMVSDLNPYSGGTAISPSGTPIPNLDCVFITYR